MRKTAPQHRRNTESCRLEKNSISYNALIQNADNLVIIGSPFSMLLHSVGEDPESDDTLVPEEGTIQCWTNRFPDNTYLSAMRSPYNSHNNCLYFHNVYNDKLSRYFKFGNLIIAVNMIHTDAQDRGNGSDQDSLIWVGVQKCA